MLFLGALSPSPQLFYYLQFSHCFFLTTGIIIHFCVFRMLLFCHLFILLQGRLYTSVPCCPPSSFPWTVFLLVFLSLLEFCFLSNLHYTMPSDLCTCRPAPPPPRPSDLFVPPRTSIRCPFHMGSWSMPRTFTFGRHIQNSLDSLRIVHSVDMCNRSRIGFLTLTLAIFHASDFNTIMIHHTTIAMVITRTMGAGGDAEYIAQTEV